MKVHMTGSEWFDDRPGGLNRYFVSLYEALRKIPMVDVSAVAFGRPPVGGETWGPANLNLASRVLRSRRSLRPVQGTIVDRHFALYGPPLSADSPLVIHFQGPWALESRMAGAARGSVAVKRWLERNRYRQADRAIVLSRAFAELLAGEYGFPAERVRVLPPGVDLDRFRPLEVAHDSQSVVCVRRLEQRMGIDVLLDGWQQVLDVHPDASLLVIGTGSEEAALKEQANRLNLTRSVRFLGRVGDAELRDAYASARCTVVPSRALEGFGLIALESLAMGRPPVVTRCGGLPDAVEGLCSSLVVDPESPEALASRLVDALDGKVPDADSCRAHAEKFGWAAVADQHVRLYQELVQQ